MSSQTFSRAGKFFGLLHSRLGGHLSMHYREGVFLYRWQREVGEKVVTMQFALADKELDYSLSLKAHAELIAEKWKRGLQKLAQERNSEKLSENTCGTDAG